MVMKHNSEITKNQESN